MGDSQRRVLIWAAVVIFVVGFAGLALYGAISLVGLGARAFYASTMARYPTQADANIIARGAFVKNFRATAVVELPPVPVQRDSPSVQLGFFSTKGNFQGGIIRSPRHHFRLYAFVAYGNRRGNADDLELVPLDDGKHVISLGGDSHYLDFRVDGRQLYHIANFVSNDSTSKLWFGVGTAVEYPGDAASGTIADFRVKRDSDSEPLRVVTPCMITHGGLEIYNVGDHWELAGRNTPGVPYRRVNCDALVRG